jgi:hypothetical protein
MTDIIADFMAGTAADPRTRAILDEQIAFLEQFLAELKALRRGDPDLDDLDLSPRIRNALRHTFPDSPSRLSQVAAKGRGELLRMWNFGAKSYCELWEVCVKHGFWSADDPAYRPTWGAYQLHIRRPIGDDLDR